MKIIEPNFSLSTPYSSGSLTRDDGVRMLRFIEHQGRISHRSEDRQNLDSWQKFIPAVVLQHGDWSITEHASITTTIRIDRGVTHEAVRHRLFAFTQESTRFVRYGDGKLEFVYPYFHIEDLVPDPDWVRAISTCEEVYHLLLKKGWRPQEARSVLPTATVATIAVTGNLRNWRLFFLMRTSKETHSDFKRISIPMLAEFQRVVPLLYDDIIPEASQKVNLEKGR